MRAVHFHSDLRTFKDAYPEWEIVLGKKGVPFTAVEVNSYLFVPGVGLILDLWGYAPIFEIRVDESSSDKALAILPCLQRAALAAAAPKDRVIVNLTWLTRASS